VTENIDAIFYPLKRSAVRLCSWSGVDEQSFEQIESEGREKWLEGIRNDLRAKTYEPQAVRRVMIPKS
jgi:retron-type reverse transcriptase